MKVMSMAICIMILPRIVWVQHSQLRPISIHSCKVHIYTCMYASRFSLLLCNNSFNPLNRRAESQRSYLELLCRRSESLRTKFCIKENAQKLISTFLNYCKHTRIWRAGATICMNTLIQVHIQRPRLVNILVLALAMSVCCIPWRSYTAEYRCCEVGVVYCTQ